MAKIADLLAAGRTVSYEFFPPKSEAAAQALDEALEDLTALGPSFVSVTYGALGSTRAPTRDLVIRIDGERPFPAMPHLTCVGQTRDDLLVLLEQYRDAGIQNVLALAGDPPPDGSDPGGDFTYATELIELARSVGDFSIGVEHPSASSSSRSRRWCSASKKNCVIAKSASASFSASRRRSVARSGERGWISGKAATPIEKSPTLRASSMSSVA